MRRISNTAWGNKTVEDNYKKPEEIVKEENLSEEAKEKRAEAQIEQAMRLAALDDEASISAAEEKKKNKVDVKREIFSWILVVVVAYILAFCITHFVIIKTEVISSSMVHTLEIGDRVIGNRLAYLFKDPERGDIIFFAYPKDTDETYVKRVIGCPGDTIKIADGKVYVNGSEIPLSEPYIDGQTTKINGEFITEANGVVVVPENSYFVLGDNRKVSQDSREWGLVTKDKIYAKAWLRYKPTIDIIESATYD